MQLDTLSPFSIFDIQPKITRAHALLRYLDSPPPPDQMFLFSQRLDSRDFPLLHAAFQRFGGSGGNLDQMSGAQRLELRLMLKEDVRPMIEQAGRDALEDKFFNSSMLPAEPVECLFRIDEMIRMKRHQIERLTDEICDLKASSLLVKRVSDNKRSADSFDQVMMISSSSALHRNRAKRPRNNDVKNE